MITLRWSVTQARPQPLLHWKTWEGSVPYLHASLFALAFRAGNSPANPAILIHRASNPVHRSSWTEFLRVVAMQPSITAAPISLPAVPSFLDRSTASLSFTVLTVAVIRTVAAGYYPWSHAYHRQRWTNCRHDGNVGQGYCWLSIAPTSHLISKRRYRDSLP